MKSSSESAELVCRHWMGSWFSCLWSRRDERAGHPHGDGDVEIQREMEICYSQPHLVPPMKLVFYDDLPSPGLRPPSSSSSPNHFSTLVSEGRSLASRASSRASLSMRRRKSRRPTIGAPSDFRREHPPAARVGPFRPLELSIYMPGNRLSDLPEFDDFNLPDFDNLPTPTFPPKALVRATVSDVALPRRNSSFQIPRKPVSSLDGNVSLSTTFLERRRSSTFWDRPGMLDESRRSFTDPLSSHPVRHIKQDSLSPTIEEPMLDQSFAAPMADLIRSTAQEELPLSATAMNHARPFTPPPQTTTTSTSSPHHHHHSPSTTSQTRKRVTQWLMRSPTTHMHPAHRSPQTTTTTTPPHVIPQTITTISASSQPPPFYRLATSPPQTPTRTTTTTVRPQPTTTTQKTQPTSPTQHHHHHHRAHTSSISTVSSTAPTMISSPTVSSLTTMTMINPNSNHHQKTHQRTGTLNSNPGFGSDLDDNEKEFHMGHEESLKFASPLPSPSSTTIKSIPPPPLSPRVRELKDSRVSEIAVVPVGMAF